MSTAASASASAGGGGGVAPPAPLTRPSSSTDSLIEHRNQQLVPSETVLALIDSIAVALDAIHGAEVNLKHAAHLLRSARSEVALVQARRDPYTLQRRHHLHTSPATLLTPDAAAASTEPSRRSTEDNSLADTSFGILDHIDAYMPTPPPRFDSTDSLFHPSRSIHSSSSPGIPDGSLSACSASYPSGLANVWKAVFDGQQQERSRTNDLEAADLSSETVAAAFNPPPAQPQRQQEETDESSEKTPQPEATDAFKVSSPTGIIQKFYSPRLVSARDSLVVGALGHPHESSSAITAGATALGLHRALAQQQQGQNEGELMKKKHGSSPPGAPPPRPPRPPSWLSFGIDEGSGQAGESVIFGVALSPSAPLERGRTPSPSASTVRQGPVSGARKRIGSVSSEAISKSGNSSAFKPASTGSGPPREAAGPGPSSLSSSSASSSSSSSRTRTDTPGSKLPTSTPELEPNTSSDRGRSSRGVDDNGSRVRTARLSAQHERGLGLLLNSRSPSSPAVRAAPSTATTPKTRTLSSNLPRPSTSLRLGGESAGRRSTAATVTVSGIARRSPPPPQSKQTAVTTTTMTPSESQDSVLPNPSSSAAHDESGSGDWMRAEGDDDASYRGDESGLTSSASSSLSSASCSHDDGEQEEEEEDGSSVASAPRGAFHYARRTGTFAAAVTTTGSFSTSSSLLHGGGPTTAHKVVLRSLPASKVLGVGGVAVLPSSGLTAASTAASTSSVLAHAPVSAPVFSPNQTATLPTPSRAAQQPMQTAPSPAHEHPTAASSAVLTPSSSEMELGTSSSSTGTATGASSTSGALTTLESQSTASGTGTGTTGESLTTFAFSSVSPPRRPGAWLDEDDQSGLETTVRTSVVSDDPAAAGSGAAWIEEGRPPPRRYVSSGPLPKWENRDEVNAWIQRKLKAHQT
ncbi:hypothetical protein V8E36_007890 [Tilletia maclaganii]